jgi:hypothetical protein
MAETNLKRIKSTLLTSGIQRTHPALYQVINQIIDFAQGSIDSISNHVGITTAGGGGGGGGGGITNATYLTSTNQLGTLPNSRQLAAGTNVTLDLTTPGQEIINVSLAAAVDHVVASDGATPIPSPLNDGFGNFIYVAYTP